MNIQAEFQFSPSNLQDFCDCRRRFQLKYLYKLSWPAIQAEPLHELEESLELGSRFHKLVHQYSLGITPEKLRPASTNNQLKDYWIHFLDASRAGGVLHPVWQPDVQRYPEVTLFTYTNGSLLVSKLDLIALFPNGTIQIYDWKTNHKLPKRKWLAEKLQTKIYPFILVQSGALINQWNPILPKQIELIYWYPSEPNALLRFQYNQAKHDEDQSFIHDLLEEIIHLREDEFFLTPYEQHCSYCVYRSLCDRGAHAGPFDLTEQYSNPEEGITIDFSEIDMIEF